MKKTLLASLSLLAILIVFPLYTQAVTPTAVGGIIKNEKGKPVAGAKVMVSCTHNGNTTTVKFKNQNGENKTPASGVYSVQFNKNDCDVGDQVTSVAEKAGHTGSNSGTLPASRTLVLSIVIIGLVVVPEFGLMTGAVALLGSIGAYLMLKKRVIA